MKISEAQRVYRANAAELRERNQLLAKRRDEAKKQFTVTGKKEFEDEAATLELSMEAVQKSYEKNQDVLSALAEQWSAEFNAEVGKQQADAIERYGKDLAKVLTVFRRLAKGDVVPGKDEQKLMEFDMKMYQAAKNMQAIAQMEKERELKKHKSLWEDEEKPEEYDPEGTANDAEFAGELPEIEIPEVAAEIDVEA